MQRSSKVAAQAQAQAVRQEEITAQESLELCKALLRVSIYHVGCGVFPTVHLAAEIAAGKVSYLRGIFPEDSFRKVEMRNLDHMSVAMLLPKDEETTRLTHWVEGGVADALERKYLHKVFFGFSKDKEGKDLLEEYVFSFSYDEDGNVHMAHGEGKGKFSTKELQPGKGTTLSGVKYQVCRLMRMLVEITNTLDQVPQERYLFLKLTYTDDTPDEYEPPMFGPAVDGGVGCFPRLPFVMEVGKVDTKHIKVGLAVKTILDAADDDWAEDCMPVADDNSNLFLDTTTAAPSAAPGQHNRRNEVAEEQSMGGGFSCAGGGHGGKVAADAGEVRQQQQPMSAAASLQESGGEAPEPMQQEQEPGADLSEQQLVELAVVQDWLLSRASSQVHIVDALARFGNIASADLDAYFAHLAAAGVLLPTDQPDCYTVSAPGTAPAAAAEEAALQTAMQNLAVGMDSQQGGLHDQGGSQRTMSVIGKRKPAHPAEEERENSQHQNMVFPETQPSQCGALVKTRKASVVKEPINQSNKRPRRAAKAEAAAAPAAAAPGRRRSARNNH